MASIISFKETSADRSASWSIDDRQYTRGFVVVTDTPTMDQKVILDDPACPKRLSWYQAANGNTDPGSICRNVSVNADKQSPLVWRGTATYSSKFDPKQDDTQDPLVRDPRWTCKFRSRQRRLSKDFDDKPYGASSTEPYPGGYEIEQRIPIISGTTWKPFFNLSLVTTLQQAVNSNTWNGFAPYTVMIDALEVDQESGTGLFQYHWSFAIDTIEKHYPTRELDAGYYQKLSSGLEQIKGRDGHALSSPALLDGSGILLAGGSPVFNEFRFVRLMAFAGIP